MSDKNRAQSILKEELRGARVVGFSYEPALFVLRLEAARQFEVDLLALWRYSDERDTTKPEERVSRDQQKAVDAEHARRMVESVDRLVTSVHLESDGTLRIDLDDRTGLLVPGISRVFDRSWMIRLPPDQDDRRSIVCDSEGNVAVTWP